MVCHQHAQAVDVHAKLTGLGAKLQRSNPNEPCYSFLALVTYIIVFYTNASVSFAARQRARRVCKPFALRWPATLTEAVVSKRQ